MQYQFLILTLLLNCSFLIAFDVYPTANGGFTFSPQESPSIAPPVHYGRPPTNGDILEYITISDELQEDYAFKSGGAPGSGAEGIGAASAGIQAALEIHMEGDERHEKAFKSGGRSGSGAGGIGAASAGVVGTPDTGKTKRGNKALSDILDLSNPKY